MSWRDFLHAHLGMLGLVTKNPQNQSSIVEIINNSVEHWLNYFNSSYFVSPSHCICCGVFALLQRFLFLLGLRAFYFISFMCGSKTSLTTPLTF